MAGPVSFVQTNFAGGEISQSAQGRMDEPAYKISLNTCLNWIPMDTGGLQRRPGTRHIGPTRLGQRAKLIRFSFEESFPYQMEFTDGALRFITGSSLVTTNDAQAVVSISGANPAVVQTTTQHGWATNDFVTFNSLGVNNPLLQGRAFFITVIDPTHFSLNDGVTGAAINGATLGAFVSGKVARALTIFTSYTSGSWANILSVQAETRTVLLNGTHPQVLQVATQPTPTQSATFTYGPSDFIDGPYLDPIAGSIVNSSALNGVVTLTFSFQAFDPTVAYNVGAFVSSAGIGYKSLTSPNQGNTPASSPASWTKVNGGAPINNGSGFLPSDVGRLLRLFSEPQPWSALTSYSTGTVVSYPDGLGGFSYWTANGNFQGAFTPGTSTLWSLNAVGASWTWAQVLSVTGTGLVPPQAAIGSLGGGGGLAAAFDGNTAKGFGSSANFTSSIPTLIAWSAVNWAQGAQCQNSGIIYQAIHQVITSTTLTSWSSTTFYLAGAEISYGGFTYLALLSNGGVPPSSDPNTWSILQAVSVIPPPQAPNVWVPVTGISGGTEDVYVGQHYAAAIAIGYATIYPATDTGFANLPTGAAQITINLRAKNSSPISASDGTVLATTTISNTFSPVTLISTNQTSTWSYVWFEIVAVYSQPLPDNGTHSYTVLMGVAQAQFYSPNINNGSVVVAQIRGPALLYNQPIRTWQLGVYSDTTGWPTCGAYHEGRIWLGGVVSNRFDACVSNGFKSAQIDFTPTSANGTVAANNSISYTCDGDDANQFLWMKSDQQGVLAGTQAGEWLISAPSQGPMAPTNIKAVRVTQIGCANAEPRRTDHTLVFIQKFSRKIMEYFADVFSGKFTAPNLSERAKHLTVSGIAEIGYQQELSPTLWVRRNDGILVGATYKRDTLMTSQGPTIIGWHRHQLGSGRIVESISVGPSHGGNLDNLSLVTNDTATGVRHLEVMSDLLDEGFALTDCSLLDNAIVPTSTAVQAAPTGGPYGSLLVNGLWDHNGKTVTAFIAGLDCGDYAVTSGSITVPFGDGVSAGTANGLFTAALVQSFVTTLPALVGFTYNSDGQLVRPVTPAETGTQAGPGFAKLGRHHYAAALLYGCVNGSIAFGTDFVTLDPAKLTFSDDTPYPVNQLWSGIWRDQVESQLDFDNMISFRVGRPLPAFVLALGGFDEKADA